MPAVGRLWPSDDDDVLQDNGEDQLPRLEERALCEHSRIQRTQPHTSLALQGIFITPMMIMMAILIILIIITMLVNDNILSTSGSLWGWGWQCCGVWTHSSQKQESQNDVQGLHLVYNSFIIFFLDWIKSFQDMIMKNINDHCEISDISDKLLRSKLQRFKDATQGNDLGWAHRGIRQGRDYGLWWLKWRRWWKVAKKWVGMDPLHCQRCSRDKVFWRDKDLFARERERDRESDRESEPQREKLEHGPEKERKKERKRRSVNSA